MNQSPPIPSSAVSDQWINDVRTIIRREGRIVRGSESNNMIEIKSPGSGEWGKLMLPGSGFEFISPQERDIVIQKLRA